MSSCNDTPRVIAPSWIASHIYFLHCQASQTLLWFFKNQCLTFFLYSKNLLIRNSFLKIRLFCFLYTDAIGVFQKISLPPPPPPPMDDHWIRYLKISGSPRRTTAVFAGFQSLLFQNLEKFQNFARLWMIFLWFENFVEILGHLAFTVIQDFQCRTWGGGGDIFSNSPFPETAWNVS